MRFPIAILCFSHLDHAVRVCSISTIWIHTLTQRRKREKIWKKITLCHSLVPTKNYHIAFNLCSAQHLNNNYGKKEAEHNRRETSLSQLRYVLDATIYHRSSSSIIIIVITMREGESEQLNYNVQFVICSERKNPSTSHMYCCVLV